MEGGKIKIGTKNVDCRHKCGHEANLQNGFQSHKYKTQIQILIQTKTKNRVKKKKITKRDDEDGNDDETTQIYKQNFHSLCINHRNNHIPFNL